MAMRWRREPKVTGLARIGAGPRSSGLYDGETLYAMVSAFNRNNVTMGWYWVSGWGSVVPHRNTYMEKLTDEATAKANAMEYVRQFVKTAVAYTAIKDATP